MEFSYTPLDPSRRQIRLITIQNGISTGAAMYPSPTVICEMKHFDFNTCPKYRALSYTWGSKQNRTQLNVNGKLFSVSQGLGAFMERARHLDWLLGKPGYLWIDQICIDQKNIPERNNQVSFMGEIYQRAMEVLIWLGPQMEGCMRAIDAMRSLDQYEMQKHQDALRALFGKPYWTRLWIVQEVLLSSSGKILCGKSWMAWSVLTQFVDTMLEKRKDIAIVRDSWPIPDSVLNIFLQRDKPIEQRTLSSVLDMFGSFQCEDIRDRVFGLQSLIPEHARVSIDYSPNSNNQVLWSTVLKKVAQNERDMSTDRLLQFALRLQDILGVNIPKDAILQAVLSI